MDIDSNPKRDASHRQSSVRTAVTLILAVLLAVAATALLIYLTPLRYTSLVPATMNEVDPKVFYAEFTAHPNDYILIDVRSASIYESAHAVGAINVPIDSMYDDRAALPHSGKQIALLCTTGKLAAVAYGYLQDQGYTNLIHIEGGMVNWTTEGLPVEGLNIGTSNPTPVVDEHQ